VVLDITYGYQVKQDGDRLVDLIHETVAAFVQSLIPGRYLVDFFPWRELLSSSNLHLSEFIGFDSVERLPSWMPGMGFKNDAIRFRNATDEINDTPFEHTKEQLVCVAQYYSNYDLPTK
jgi:hypothetical protein